jgi:hypothetical protein
MPVEVLSVLNQGFSYQGGHEQIDNDKRDKDRNSSDSFGTMQNQCFQIFFRHSRANGNPVFSEASGYPLSRV